MLKNFFLSGKHMIVEPATAEQRLASTVLAASYVKLQLPVVNHLVIWVEGTKEDLDVLSVLHFEFLR
jgi:hypothetical protein